VKAVQDIYTNFVQLVENLEVPLKDFAQLLKYRPTKELQRELNKKNLD